MTRRRNPASARLDAIAAVDAYKRARPNGRFMFLERQTLERLRSDKRFGEVWQQIEPYLKREDRERLIASIVHAARMALEGHLIVTGSQSNIESWKQAKRHAKALYNFLERSVKIQPARYQHKQYQHDERYHYEQYQHLLTSLSWLLEFISEWKVAERDPHPTKLAAGYGLSRQFRSSPHTTFMKFMGKDIVDICGKLLDQTVALLAEIVLKTRATRHQARSPRRPTTRSERRHRR